MRIIWLLFGIISFALGFIGAFLPLLPTVPFMLLSAFCFSKSSERLHNWLLSHKIFGPFIEDWNRNGSINKRAKIVSTVSIAFVFCISLFLGVKPVILIIQAVVLSSVLVFIWSRPAA